MKIDETIYLDHQATTPVHPDVFSEMEPYFGSNFGNPHSSSHSIGWRSNFAVENARKAVADAISASPDEIFFVSGATEANNTAIKGLLRSWPSQRRTILATTIEHKCVLAAASSMRFHGIETRKCAVNREGFVDLNSFEQELMHNDVHLASVMHTNNEIGTVQPIRDLAKIAHDHGTLFHTDAAQALIGAVINVDELDVDMLSLSSHKIYGPKGIGALYIRRDHQKLITPLLEGGGQESGIRSGTVPTALAVGFGQAASMAARNHVQIREHLVGLCKLLEKELRRIAPSANINGPLIGLERHPGNLNIAFENENGDDLISKMQPKLAISTGSACTSGIPEPSHVLMGIGLAASVAESSIRFSPGIFTTNEDIYSAVEIISEALGGA